MDGRTLELLDLPNEMIDEICRWLPPSANDLLNFRSVSKATCELADSFIQHRMPEIPLVAVFNNNSSHYLYLCSIFKKNPNLLLPLQNPATLFNLCTQLDPIGLLRLSIIFPIFHIELYQPLESAVFSDDASGFLAFICYALMTTDVEALDIQRLNQAIRWLDAPANKEKCAAISLCLGTIDRIQHARLARSYIDTRDLPEIPCYLNLQGSNLRSAKLIRANLRYANLQGADARDAEFLNGQLIGTYLKNTQLRDGHFIDTIFFNLSNSKTPLSLQLTMLDHQLTISEHPNPADDAVTTDLLKQIRNIPSTDAQLQTIAIAENHPFFSRRHPDNYNIRIAINKARDNAKRPLPSHFFTRPALQSAFHATTPKHSIPKPSSPQ